MSNQLRVSLIQQSLAWHAPEENRRQFADILRPLAGTTDLVVLPEMFTTGFTMDAARLAEPENGTTLDWLRRQAAALDAAITGSIIVADASGQFRNRLYWVPPDGTVAFYDKRHLFRMGGEHQAFVGGSGTLLVDWRGARIGLLVCYDLRFPVWSRRRPGFDYDLLVYVANWPAARAQAWSLLLRARAIENQAFVVGVNRIGRDGHGVPHRGDSAAIDYLGASLVDAGGEPAAATTTLDLAALGAWRTRFPAHLDADRFKIEP